MEESLRVMARAYDEWPVVARRAYARGASTALPARYAYVDSIVVCGMGGSGVVGDYVAVLAEEHGRVPVIVVKDYRLPIWSSRSLVLAVSYSGNTVETLNCYLEARRRGACLVAISSGGRLRDYARQHGVPWIPVDKAPAARLAFASMLYVVLGLVQSLGLLHLPEPDVEESIRVLEEGGREAAEKARNLAVTVKDALPVIATTRRFEPLALRMKNELNENAKVPAKVEVLPEWGHNDIEGWSDRLSQLSYAFIVLDSGEPTESSLLDVAEKVYRKISEWIARIKLLGGSLLAKLVWGTYLAGIASLELAKMLGVDPLATLQIREYRAAVEKVLARGNP